MRLTGWFFYSTLQPYAVHFAPRQTTQTAAAAAAADVSPKLLRDSVELPAARMRQLFETASAVRRRHVYAQAKKLGVDRLAWRSLVCSSVDDQPLARNVARPSPARPDASYCKLRCVRTNESRW